MMVSDRRGKQTSVLLVLSTKNDDKNAVKLVNLQVDKASSWTQSTQAVSNPREWEDKLKNCIILEDDFVILTFNIGFLILDKSLSEVNCIYLR